MCEVLYEALCEAKLQNAAICDGDQTQRTKDRSKEHDGTFTMSEATSVCLGCDSIVDKDIIVYIVVYIVMYIILGILLCIYNSVNLA